MQEILAYAKAYFVFNYIDDSNKKYHPCIKKK